MASETERAENFARLQKGLEDGFANGAVKVKVELGEASMFGIGSESFWATPFETPDTFVIDNVPFFTPKPTYGDIVRAHPDPVAAGNGHFFVYDEVVTPGGWEWFTAIVDGDVGDAMKKIRGPMTQSQLKMEGGFDRMVVGVYRPEVHSYIHETLTEKPVIDYFMTDEEPE